jgi:hypothetical protein
VLLDAASASISIQSGAFKTSTNKGNQAVSSVPVITFNTLDRTQDHRIGLDDIVRIIRDSALHIDVNLDGVFDQEDIRSLLNQISPQ